MKIINYIKIWSCWIILLGVMPIIFDQSYALGAKNKKMEQEMRQTLTKIGYNLEWRTVTNGGEGHLVLNFPDGRIIRDIAATPTVAVSLSPDASKIAFFKADSFTFEKWLDMNLIIEDISTGTRESPGLIVRSPSLLAWSPDGKKLALIAERASTDSDVKWPDMDTWGKKDTPNQLFIFSITDKKLETLNVLDVRGIGSDQAWSPKGDEIIYTVLHSRKPPLDIEIRILSLTTKKTRSLCRGEFPTWSSVNNKIVFRDPDKNYYLINPDGSDKTLLLTPDTKRLYDLGSPILWSPDGRWLLVDRGAFNDTVDLYVLDPETKTMVKIESMTEPRGSWKGKRE